MSNDTPFLNFARLCEALEGTRKRKEKKHLISVFLLKLKEDEVQPAISFLIGKVFPESDQSVLKVGYQILSHALRKLKQTTLIEKSLTILEVNKYFKDISSARGSGSRRRKTDLIQRLFSQASLLEGKYLTRIIMGEMRIGAVEGVVLESISIATSTPLDLVRRGNMLLGNIGEVAKIALKEGEKGVNKISIQLFTPIKPMLATASDDLNEVFKYYGKIAFEYKLDGARIQIHLRDQDIRIFSRRLTNVTKSLPDMVELIRKEIRAEETVLEGEVIAISSDEKPLPFQDLMRRFRRVHKIEEMVNIIPLKLQLFDILYLNGETLIDEIYMKRRKILSKICDSPFLVKRLITDVPSKAKAFLDSAIKAGHEGLIAKALDSNYIPGVRGKKWFKIKPFENLDLVIVAADWGHGRRVGWLSNYHLAAKNEETGEFLDVGKTFKGLTDNEFKEMTLMLNNFKIDEDKYTVYVKPKVVVEVSFNEIQRSSHYKSGFALRFARIMRIRHDKGPLEVDTIGRISEFYEKQFKFKGKLKLK